MRMILEHYIVDIRKASSNGLDCVYTDSLYLYKDLKLVHCSSFSYPLLLVEGPFPLVEAPVLEPTAISFGFSPNSSA